MKASATVATHGGLVISMRAYFSTYQLYAAKHFAARAQQVEANHEGRSRFDIRHRAFVLGAITSAAAFLEANVNELFQDAVDGHGLTGDGYLAPLGLAVQQQIASTWLEAGVERAETLVKYQRLMEAADTEPLDPGREPMQSARLLVALRNALVHSVPESVSPAQPRRFRARLKGRFPDNALMGGSGNAWWPDHCLGAGCATWAWQRSLALADRVATELDVKPNYRRHLDATWSGLGQPPEELLPSNG